MGSPASALPLTRSSVIAAHELIKPHIHLTPVLTSTTLSTLASTPQSPEALKGTEYEGQEPAKPKMRLFFKCENYQKVGAFKARGAFHAIARLSDEQLQKGVVTHSSGMCASRLLSFTLFILPAPPPAGLDTASWQACTLRICPRNPPPHPRRTLPQH